MKRTEPIQESPMKKSPCLGRSINDLWEQARREKERQEAAAQAEREQQQAVAKAAVPCRQQSHA